MPNTQYLKDSLEESERNANRYREQTLSSDPVDTESLGKWWYWAKRAEQTADSLERA